MPIIEFRFPASRLHATPWGRHVNEGAVEWPPSPWRILRALVATWHLKARTDVPELVLRELLHTLASKPPVIQLPTASLGHTRHYMPIIEGKNQKTTKVFDAFIHERGPVEASPPKISATPVCPALRARLSAERGRASAAVPQ